MVFIFEFLRNIENNRFPKITLRTSGPYDSMRERHAKIEYVFILFLIDRCAVIMVSHSAPILISFQLWIVRERTAACQTAHGQQCGPFGVMSNAMGGLWFRSAECATFLAAEAVTMLCLDSRGIESWTIFEYVHTYRLTYHLSMSARTMDWLP